MSGRRAPVLGFLGAAGTVTGSRFLLEAASSRVLVDAGLFQGSWELRRRNWDPLPTDPGSLDAIVVSHAHVDHIGLLPLLVRDGYQGRVVASPSTAALAGVVLPDSGHLQEEEAAYANRKGYSKHRPALPLYTEADAHRAVERFVPRPFGQPVPLAEGVTATLRPAGHILGSSTITLRLDGEVGRTIVFSGDLGRPNHPLLVPPAPLGDADVVVVESTYGDRRHDDAGIERLGAAINRTVARGGTVLIPAFAVDRTEVILHHLARLRAAGALEDVPVYVDSPMALAALAVYRHAIDAAAPDVRTVHDPDADRFDGDHVVEVRDVEASKALAALRFPAIIISASGMATGGRVVHHLSRLLPDHRNTVVLAGFQAAGTRGRSLADGARQVKMLGRYVPVRAEVVAIDALSVHADQQELLNWLATAARPPEALYIVHGEPHASAALQARIEDELGWPAVIPHHLERVRLD
jgi:metallo-beta-lactamase family protein